MEKSVIKLHDILVKNNRVDYVYSCSPDLEIYFQDCEPLFISYDFDVTNVPKSILAIPWMSNFVLISWFTGCTIVIDEIDEEFVKCLDVLKDVFSKTYPEILYKKSKIDVVNTVKNNYPVHKEAMLFSGGLDAWTTFLKHKDKKFDLITIQGSDIELHDAKKMQLIKTSYQENPLLGNLPAHFISCNFRNFYNHSLEKLIYFNYADWWTLVQHGLVLTASAAPLAYHFGYSSIFIASSFSEKEEFLWGSSELDNHIKFGNTTIIHDGREFDRLQKTEFIVNQLDILKTAIPLRVCYKHGFSDFNCGLCPKCLRMILSLILYNKNPNDFGFQVDPKVYDIIINQLETESFGFAHAIFWSEINAKIKAGFSFYVFEKQDAELEKIFRISELITRNCKGFPDAKFKRRKFKNGLRNLFFKLRGIISN